MLSAQIADEGEYIRGGVEALARIDLLFAKGRYSAMLNAAAPEIVPNEQATDAEGNIVPSVQIRAGRHPLIDPHVVVRALGEEPGPDREELLASFRGAESAAAALTLVRDHVRTLLDAGSTTGRD